MPRRILDYYVEIMREMEKEKGEETKNERLEREENGKDISNYIML